MSITTYNQSWGINIVNNYWKPPIMMSIEVMQSIDHILNTKINKDIDTVSIHYQVWDKDAYFLSRQIIEYISLKWYKTSTWHFSREPAIIGVVYDENKKLFMVWYMY